MKINLFYTASTPKSLQWKLGDCIYCGADTLSAIRELRERIQPHTGDYLLFIDLDKYSFPEEHNILNIINNAAGEIWHIGLKESNYSFPILYNYYQPTWMYNLNAPNDIPSTSWQLSADCFLSKKEIIVQLWHHGEQYKHITSIGRDLGYRILNSGAIIRYEPSLSDISAKDSLPIPLTEDCIFMKRNIGNKWYLWSLFRHIIHTKKPISAIRSAFLAKGVTKVTFNTFNRNTSIINSENRLTQPTISVFTPTLQRYEYLETELIQLRQQTIKPSQIIITDQTDLEYRDTSFLKNFRDLPILYQEQNEKGQCNAWNYCLENASGEYVLFLGDDADEIQPDFVEQLYKTMIEYKADVVACNIKEDSTEYPFNQPDVFITDTFPICLVKKSALEKTGGYDYAFNKGIRADADVSLRLHLSGALLVLNPHVKLFHHRAPVGGLRHHKQRQITNKTSKNSIRIFQLPTATEIYLYGRYFTALQSKEMILLKILSSLSVKGSKVKQLMKIFVAVFSARKIYTQLSTVKASAEELKKHYPRIPSLLNKQI